jgi:hypothetical protein
MDALRGGVTILASRVAGIRRVCRNRLVVALHGRRHDQGTPRKGENRIKGPNAAFSPTREVFRSASLSTVPITMTPRGRARHWRAPLSNVLVRPKMSRWDCASTRHSTRLRIRCGNSQKSFDSSHTFVIVAKKEARGGPCDRPRGVGRRLHVGRSRSTQQACARLLHGQARRGGGADLRP